MTASHDNGPRLNRDEKKTAARREKRSAEDLTAALLDAKPQILHQVELEPELREALVQLRAAFGKKERPRLLRFVTKLVRESDMEAISASLTHSVDTGGSDPITRLAERWRDRLCVEGDPALSELFDDFPDADRTLMRQTVMKAQKSQSTVGADPSRARREVLLRVRELLRAQPATGETAADAADPTDATNGETTNDGAAEAP